MKVNVRLPLAGCPGGLLDYDPPGGLRPDYHDWSMPLGCPTHDYAHVVGICCWRCGQQVFFWSRRCWKTRHDPDADLQRQRGWQVAHPRPRR